MECKVIIKEKELLEKEVNDWLDKNKLKIFNITQTENDGFITLTIFYNDLKETRKLKLDKISKINKSN